MGAEPFPYDARGGCWCHQNCADWRRPSKRYWFVIPGALIDAPALASGVLTEYYFQSFPDYICRWGGVDVGPPDVDVEMEMKPVLPVPGNQRTVDVQVRINGIVEWAGVWTLFSPENCGFDDVTLANPTVDVNGWGSGLLYRINWYQDAGDVPH